MGVKTYDDPYVLCPFYSREESVKAIKIHCEGFRKGTHLHICFDKKELKKAHKKAYCKSVRGYQNCPLYPVITQYREDDDE